MALARGYDARFIGTGSDEFRKIVNAGVSLTAAIAVVSFVIKSDIARGYVVIALPCATLFSPDWPDTGCARGCTGGRRKGECMRRVVAVGHAAGVTPI